MTVPPGKKWVLKIDEPVLLNLSNAALNPNNRNYVMLNSNPRMVSSIIEGHFGNPNEVYGLMLKSIEQVEDYTYEIVIHRIFSSKLEFSTLSGLDINEIDIVPGIMKELVFLPGQIVYVDGAFDAIHVLEMPLTKSK